MDVREGCSKYGRRNTSAEPTRRFWYSGAAGGGGAAAASFALAFLSWGAAKVNK